MDSTTVSFVLSSIVESVLARLDDQGLPATELAKEWSAIQEADQEEVDFCVAAARLGLDPYSEVAEVEGPLLRVAEELSGNLYTDFLDAVDPARIVGGLDWISKARQIAQESKVEPEQIIGELRKAARQEKRAEGMPPWAVGWEQARRIREVRGLIPASRFEPNEYLTVSKRLTHDPGLQAAGSTQEHAKPVVVVGRDHLQKARRFTLSRAFWHVVAEDEPLFLVTGAYTDRQKIERAFAAELLAPAAGIAERLGTDISETTPEELEHVAEHFGVSPMVVQHQIENQILANA